MSMPQFPFDLRQLFSNSYKFDISGSYQTACVYVVRTELLYEVIRAHTLLLQDPEHCGTDDLLELFTGFVPSPYDITWFSSYNPNKIVERAAMKAAQEGNMFAVAELLTVDNNNPPMQRVKKA